MNRGIMVSAPSSSSGKTVMTMTLLELLKRHGYRPAAFKTGPDYIDPMYHRAVTGQPVLSLDTFLAEPRTVRKLYAQCSENHDISVVEGAMGFYDGLDGTSEKASAYETAKLLGLPVVYVLPARGTALSDSALLRGAKDFRKDSGICAVLLCRCSQTLYERTAPVIEKETGIPVCGYLPKMPEAELPSRHLGLFMAGEISDLVQRTGRLADAAEKTIDLDRLLKSASEMEDIIQDREDPPEEVLTLRKQTDISGLRRRPVIAVARDEAFRFLYEENLSLLNHFGAEIRFFSPIFDSHLPEEADGLYLPGGYPELHGRALSENTGMLDSIRKAFADGMPVIAECGGYMYLCEELETEEGCFPMVGIFPGHMVRTKGLVRFGYAYLTAERDSLLFRRGQSVPVHSFHHYDAARTDSGEAFSLAKPLREECWKEGFSGDTYYAAFPHLYFPGCPEAAERFAEAACQYRKKKL